MQDTIKAAKVGALVIVALLGAVFVYRAVDEASSSGRGYRVYAMFEDAQGLIPKSRVTIAGINVGHIERIVLDHGRARVEIAMNPDAILYRDASILRRAASLLGEYILVINPGTTTEPRMPDGGRIESTDSSPTITDMISEIRPVVRNIRAVTQQLERSFGTDEAGRQMQSALRNLSEALERINVTIADNQASVRNIVSNVEGITDRAGPRLDAILENVEVTTADIRTLLANNRTELDNGVGEVDDTIASIHRASEQLEDVLEDINEVTERTAAGEGTIGRLTSDEHLINEVESSVEGVSDIIGGISRLRTYMQLRSEYNFLANTFKNYFSLRLMPREGRYFLIELVDDPRGRTSFQSVQVRRSPPGPNEPEFYEEERVTVDRSFNFTVQLAQRISFLTFRFGILESTGGIGLDASLIDDRLEINADVFGFSLSRFPRVRFRGAFEIIDTLYIVAGADDILNERTIDFFGGLQVRFDDLDLVSLLPFAGGAIAGGR